MVPNDMDRSSHARSGAVSRRLLIGMGLAFGVLFGVLAAIEAIWGLATVSMYERTVSPPRPAGAGSP